MPKTRRKDGNEAQTARPTEPAQSFSRRHRLLLAILALAVGGATWAVFEFVVWNKLPAELVGKWVVVEGPQEGATFDFYRSGTMVGVINVRGKEGHINARIRVEGTKIYSTTRHPKTGEQMTRVQVIRVLTAKELVLQDEQGQILKMERAL